MSRGSGSLADPMGSGWPTDPVPVEALLEEAVKFVTDISLAKDTKSSPPPALHTAKATFRRLKLWKQRYHTEERPLDKMLSYAPVQAETVLALQFYRCCFGRVWLS